MERRIMADRRRHPDGSECPLNQEAVEKLLGTLNSIDYRLQKIEKFMFVGHVVVWTIGIMAGAFWWVNENIDNLRLIIKDFIK